MRNIDHRLIEVTLKAEQDDTPIRGNYVATDEPNLDRQAEDTAIAELEAGNVWAWAVVIVEATYPGLPFIGRDVLGACSYQDEDEFKTGGYYDEMVEVAKADLLGQMHKASAVLCDSL